MLAVLVLSCALPMQNGDKQGEEQPALDRQWPLPPSPPLGVEEQLATFRLPAGYAIEAVAAEPLVGDPVDVAWDARGRMWVVEMTSLMRNADGSDELEPDCSIAILSDTDEDGVYDKREVFLDGLVLPRSVCFVPNGVVAILPPQIVFLQDLDGDGKPDHREILADGLNAGLSNPEHAANSLTLAMDNWIYAANHGWRYRRVDGEWQREKSARIGQWGMSEDDYGRMAVNYNSSAVHVSVVPLAAAVRNEAYGTAMGTNMRTTEDTTVYPSRINPGVNRGYRVGTLREDGRLARLTGACGPAWFTGTAMDETDRGRLFSCEPCGNLVQRFDVEDVEGLPKATLMRNDDGLDFLTSTDERFRPVNLRVGPDGALYVVDMYRGILQHKVFLTSFLRRQAEERGLVDPTGLGRIWRISKEDAPRAKPIALEGMASEELIGQLGNRNKWQRMTAQRLLLERGKEEETVEACIAVVQEPPSSVNSSHALWYLEGVRVAHEQPFIRSLPKELWRIPTNIYAATNSAKGKAAAFVSFLAIEEATPASTWAALSLNPATFNPFWVIEGEPALKLLDDPIAVGAILSNPSNQSWSRVKVTYLRMLREGDETENRRRFLQTLGKLLILRQSGKECSDFLSFLYGGTSDWVATALLEGAVSALPAHPDPSRFRFAEPEPKDWIAYRKLGRDEALTSRLVQHLQWGVTDSNVEQEVTELPSHIQRGAEVYARSCGTCHQPDGKGMAGLAPPFLNSEWLALPDRRLADIALNGMDGPIEVDGVAWDMTMPGWPTLNNQEIADVLNYILHQWADEPRTITAELVLDVRVNGLGEMAEELKD
ncbi:MAG: PVC-type heme-binding CxxCH protein [Planctomycetota bacterium]